MSKCAPPPVNHQPPAIQTYASKFPGSPEEQAYLRGQHNAKQQTALNAKHAGGRRRRRRRRSRRRHSAMRGGAASPSPAPSPAPSPDSLGWVDPDNPTWVSPDDPHPSWVRIPQSHTGVHEAGPQTANRASILGNKALMNGNTAARYDSCVQFTPTMGQSQSGGRRRRRRKTRRKRRQKRITRRRRKIRRRRKRTRRGGVGLALAEHWNRAYDWMLFYACALLDTEKIIQALTAGADPNWVFTYDKAKPYTLGGRLWKTMKTIRDHATRFDPQAAAWSPTWSWEAPTLEKDAESVNHSWIIAEPTGSHHLHRRTGERRQRVCEGDTSTMVLFKMGWNGAGALAGPMPPPHGRAWARWMARKRAIQRQTQSLFRRLVRRGAVGNIINACGESVCSLPMIASEGYIPGRGVTNASLEAIAKQIAGNRMISQLFGTDSGFRDRHQEEEKFCPGWVAGSGAATAPLAKSVAETAMQRGRAKAAMQQSLFGDPNIRRHITKFLGEGEQKKYTLSSEAAAAAAAAKRARAKTGDRRAAGTRKKI